MESKPKLVLTIYIYIYTMSRVRAKAGTKKWGESINRLQVYNGDTNVNWG